MQIKKISSGSAQRRVALHSAVASQIGSLIVLGKVPPGSVLPNETSLGIEFGVSRTALREAIKVLASKGLVEVRRKTGTRVNEHMSWNMLDPEVLEWMFSGDGVPSGLADLMEVRRLVEPAAARMAAERATKANLVEMQEAYQLMEKSTGNLPTSVEADLRFHLAILESTHNAFMRPFGALIQAALRGSFRLTSSDVHLYRITLPLHKNVLDCIVSGDGKKAAAAMEAVLTQTVHDIEEQTRAAQRRDKNRKVAKRPSHRGKIR